MKRTVVWLTDSQIKALGKISLKSLAPISALVRKAVEQFIEEQSNATRITHAGSGANERGREPRRKRYYKYRARA